MKSLIDNINVSAIFGEYNGNGETFVLWDIMRDMFVVGYRLFGKTNRFHLQRSGIVTTNITSGRKSELHRTEN